MLFSFKNSILIRGGKKMKQFQLTEGVYCGIEQSNQFKKNIIQIKFSETIPSPFTIERTLLSLMLIDSNQTLPSKEAVASRLDELYGASIKSSIDTKGTLETVEFSMEFIDGRYIGNNLWEKQLRTLSDFIFNPLDITPSMFQEAVNKLTLLINNYNDQVSSLARDNAWRLCGGLLAAKCIPTIEEVHQTTIERVQQAYQLMITENRVDCLLFINDDSEEIIQLFKKHFSFSPRKSVQGEAYLASIDTYKEKTIVKNIHQSNMILLYTSNINIYSSDYCSLVVANAILGGLPTSFLFQEIREKRSFCYSIHSTLDNYEGILRIQTGIDYKNIDEVKKLIEEQINRIINDDFDDDILHASKRYICNSINSYQDRPKLILNSLFNQSVYNSPYNNAQLIQAINNVTRENVREALKKCTLQCVVTVRQEEDNEE